MPLSKKPKDTGKDIKQLVKDGYKRRQALAIALSVIGQAKKR